MVDRIFRFAMNFKNAIDNSVYSDNSDPVAYSGDVFVVVQISDWERIGIVAQNNIRAKANLDNFVEVESI